LDAEIFKDSKPGPFGDLSGMAELFLEDMKLTFDPLGDGFPYQWLNLIKRPKAIHPVGPIANAVWKVEPNTLGYTGAFASGCTHGYIRLSFAAEPKKNPRNITPGIGFKCLRNQVHSGNLVAMYNLLGQDSWNFFAHDLSNHGPDVSPNSPSIIRALKWKFAEASVWPLMTGVSDFARYDQNGERTFSPVFPYRLIFHPTTAIHNSFPDTPQEPAEEVLARGLSQPQDLYYVYAVPSPDDQYNQEKWVKIATIAITSSAKTSNFGDKSLYFRHTRMEDDFELRPEWIEPTKNISAYQRSVDYYRHPTMDFLVTTSTPDALENHDKGKYKLDDQIYKDSKPGAFPETNI